MCAQIHIATPEFRKSFGLYCDMFNPWGILGGGYRGNDLIHHQFKSGDSIFSDINGYRFAVEVPWRSVPLLSLSIIHGKLNGMTRREIKCFIDVKQSLYLIFPWGNL